MQSRLFAWLEPSVKELLELLRVLNVQMEEAGYRLVKFNHNIYSRFVKCYLLYLLLFHACNLLVVSLLCSFGPNLRTYRLHSVALLNTRLTKSGWSTTDKSKSYVSNALRISIFDTFHHLIDFSKHKIFQKYMFEYFNCKYKYLKKTFLRKA